MTVPQSIDDPPQTIVFQTVPEEGDGVENLGRSLEKPRLIKTGLEEDLLQLLHRVAGVLGFDAVVPREEGNPSGRAAGSALICSKPSSSSCQKPAAAQFSTAKLAPSAIWSSSLP